MLYSFQSNGTGTDAGAPGSGLIQASDGNFCGTAGGGVYGAGTIFKVTPAGVETVLYSFSGYVSGSADGALPASGVIHGSDGNFYGTTTGGGTNSGGTVFRVTLSGAETVLYSFSNTSLASNDAEVNLFQPGLIQGRDGNFYGTTAFGGNAGTGTVYKLTNVIAAP